MISPRKFQNLPPKNRLRKLARVVHEHLLALDREPFAKTDPSYREILRTAGTLEPFSPWKELILQTLADPGNLRVGYELEVRLSQALGEGPGDWDLTSPRIGTQGPLPSTEVRSGARLEVFLEDLRSPFNVGSIFRTADGVGCSKVLLTELCPGPGHPRTDRSSMGTTQVIPWARLGTEELLAYASSQDLVPVALELGGRSLWDEPLPERCLFILGSEELGVSPEILSQVDRVSIPMVGRKASLNVGVSFGIAGAWWLRQVGVTR